MNNKARNDATNRRISLNNEATLDTAVFSGVTPVPNEGADAAAALRGVLGYLLNMHIFCLKYVFSDPLIPYSLIIA